MHNITMELKVTTYTIKQLPHLTLPQIALAGRSNVGKSSLINALAGRKKLAKVSSTPGKTRSINFYLVQPWNFYIVDLPGYGYAQASQTERNNWAKVLEYYLANGGELRVLVLLLDCRVSPQNSDRNLVTFAESHNLSVLPVLTKIDKCKAREMSERRKQWQEILGVKALMVSSTARKGIEELWKQLIISATGRVPDFAKD